MHISPGDTVRSIVAADFRTAAVFHRHGIPFCCGGDRPLAEACRERGVAEDEVRDALARATTRRDRVVPQVDGWELETLTAYIVGHHHAHLRLMMPALAAHTRKVAASHGAARPELREVARIVEELVLDLTSHMAKEENILFPYIVALADPRRREPVSPPFADIEHPLRMMAAEHERALAAAAEMRRLTGAYTVPPDACTTYRVSLAELDAFERDLRTHVHLEEHVLFPRARALAERVGADVHGERP